MVVAILTARHTAAGTSPSPPPQNPVLQRFLTLDNSGPRQVTTIRHLEARNEHFDRDAWMDVRTEADPSGFRFRVLAEGGSAYIRSRVFNVALQSEQKLWADGASERATFTTDNYLFEDRGQEPGGLAWLGVTPRREDLLLVNGSIFLRPADGDLVRIEGTLSKTPSFWTRKVDIVRHYRRIAGVRLPVALESTADVRIAGISTFSMTFTYETVNGSPIP
jgi:hypothetical protein